MTTPSGFFIAKSSIPSAGYGAWTKTRVRKFTVLGEYEGEEHKIEGNSPYSWVVCTYCMYFGTGFKCFIAVISIYVVNRALWDYETLFTSLCYSFKLNKQ